MKKLRITVDGKVFDVSVELLDQVSSTTAAPAPAPVAAPAPAAATAKHEFIVKIIAIIINNIFILFTILPHLSFILNSKKV